MTDSPIKSASSDPAVAGIKPATTPDLPDVLIIGAGVIGLCSALELQARGLSVTLVDREGPGTGASRGNAGHFATEQVHPLAAPGILKSVPAMLTDPLGPLSLRWQYLPRLLPWFARFMMAARPKAFERGTQALVALNNRAFDAWERLAARQGLQAHLRRDGSLLVFETDAAWRSAEAGMAELCRWNVPVESWDAGRLRQAQPALSKSLVGALFFPDTGHTLNPFDLCQALAGQVIQQGGQIETAEVSELSLESRQVQARTGDGRSFQGRRLLVAAGAWSKPLARQLGRTVPLDTEIGYHLMLPDPGEVPTIAVTSGERKFIMTPMRGGLRLAGTVEFAKLGAAPRFQRAEKLREHAVHLLPELDCQDAVPWQGFRPTLPDYLPVISKDPERDTLFWAFGHQHLGLTQAALTGEIMADLICGNNPVVDLTPYRIDRF
ncbi:NAD(P)/FAD-dependent oxidoreductase [Rhodovibrionaceae bacterium A322]